MKHNRIAYALIVALTGVVAFAGCKKKEEEPVAMAPAATEAAPAPADTGPAMAPAPVSSFAVGNAAGADKSVTPTATFGAKDKIIVSVKTDAATPVDAAISAKLTYQDGQTAGEQTGTVKAEDAGTTNIIFEKASDWPAGKYTVDVTLNGQPVGASQEIEVK